MIAGNKRTRYELSYMEMDDAPASKKLKLQ
jgi:hypothetical protein